MAESEKVEAQQDVIEACEQLVTMLSAKQSEEINNCSMLVFSKFLRATYEQRDKLEMLSVTVSNMLDGKLLTAYLQYLRHSNNANAENAIQCYIILMNLVWNTVGDFGEYTLHLLNNGLGAILKKDLQFVRLQLISSAPEVGESTLLFYFKDNSNKKTNNRILTLRLLYNPEHNKYNWW